MKICEIDSRLPRDRFGVALIALARALDEIKDYGWAVLPEDNGAFRISRDGLELRVKAVRHSLVNVEVWVAEDGVDLKVSRITERGNAIFDEVSKALVDGIDHFSWVRNITRMVGANKRASGISGYAGTYSPDWTPDLSFQSPDWLGEKRGPGKPLVLVFGAKTVLLRIPADWWLEDYRDMTDADEAAAWVLQRWRPD